MCFADAIPSARINGNSTVNEGSSLHLTCAATNCNGTCSYQWTFGSLGPLKGSDYRVAKVNRTQTGVHTCTVSDHTGTGNDTLNVTVYCK